MRFTDDLKARVSKAQKRIVLPETNSRRVLKAAERVLADGFAKIILIGSEEQIHKDAEKFQITLEGAEIIDPATYGRIDELCAYFAKRREKKGMTPEKAREIMLNNYTMFACGILALGDADGVVSGAATTSADVIRAGLQVIGPKPGNKTVSSAFILITNTPQYGDNGILVLGDCGVIPDPTAEQLADIATSAAETAIKIAGINPRVALMTFSTKGSAKHECVDRVIEAGHILRERKVQFRFDDELQADAALVKSVGEIKAPLSDVSGNANVLIFPSLSAGNIGYKLVQRLAGANAYGPIIQGLNAPVNDLSRGCSVEDIVVLTAITSAQACVDC